MRYDEVQGTPCPAGPVEQRRWWEELAHNGYLNWVFNGAPRAPPGTSQGYSIVNFPKLPQMRPLSKNPILGHESAMPVQIYQSGLPIPEPLRVPLLP